MRTLKGVGDMEEELRRVDQLREQKRKLEEGKEAIRAYMEKAQLSTFSTAGGCSATISKGKKKRFDKIAFSRQPLWRRQRPRFFEIVMRSRYAGTHDDCHFPALRHSFRQWISTKQAAHGKIAQNP